MTFKRASKAELSDFMQKYPTTGRALTIAFLALVPFLLPLYCLVEGIKALFSTLIYELKAFLENFKLLIAIAFLPWE